MSIFPLFRSHAERFLPDADMQKIVAAIRAAEQKTSGEIRIFIESKCPFVNAVDRASEIFFGLKMDLTEARNAVLVYVATRDRQYALFADEGIYREMGQDYWHQEAAKMLNGFRTQHYVDGIIEVVNDIGRALQDHFPYDRQTDKNELPDDIVFGR